MIELEQKIGYHFQNRALLRTALSHSSYANEVFKDGLKSYERLEFLGDSILGFVTADFLYSTFPGLLEGRLTRLRAELVCEKSLALSAERLNLGAYLLLGHGEEAGGGRGRSSIVADVMEAIIAAIYLDGGFPHAKEFIYRFVLVDVEQRVRDNVDYKTKLQELVQRQKNQTLVYSLTGVSGPDHDKRFAVAVELNGRTVGTGQGTSKKRAEQAAAQMAITAMFPGDL